MANIANKIDAKDKTLAEVLRGNRYTVESFQREYRWQREHIEALISDLAISFLKNYKEGDEIDNYDEYDCYYMGPIVLCDEKRELSIVDGQQRLTSFTLLLIYLKHAQSVLNIDSKDLKEFKDYLYVTKGGKTTTILNVPNRVKVLEHLYNSPYIEFENEDLIESTDSNPDSKNIKDESVDNIISRFEDITKLFPEEINTSHVLPIFIEWLLEKVVMVEVKAYSLENAFTIFETMNDRGLSLNSTEILKGILLSKIEDDKKSEEMNIFWKERIAEIKSITGADKDLDFFRAWLRAKYADTIRPTKQGAINEDFEIIGTQFHSWVKNNPTKTFLKKSDDYYFFIRSDFDFFSNLYIRLCELKETECEGFEDIYNSNFYPIADSLSYPLIMSPISKIDDNSTIEDKIRITSKYIDIYTLTRVLTGKAITQSTIRYSIYDLVKSVRNLETKNLKERLISELDKLVSRPNSPFYILHRMDNWGFFHYLFARLLYRVDGNDKAFESLLRSRKQSSLVLYKFFGAEEFLEGDSEAIWSLHVDSVAGHCLVYRFDLDAINSKKGIKRLQYLLKQNYMPEMNGIETNSIIEFISIRDNRLRSQIDDLLRFDL